MQAVQAYLNTKVSTASQKDLVVLIFESAIRYLKQAKEKIKEKDYAQKGILISKALDCIAELDASLNMEKGGDIAKNLHALYFYCQTRLLQANMNLDPKKIDEVISILQQIGTAFAEIKNSSA
ncbi:flagellar biosynthetic protein FliS [Desulfonauticus submarinus]|uniref:Flagellar biosynthetic protein FliS n=1 Tax=Desulfonauticus submarinus TaxID=206665 RepID=A0A1H0D4Z3_9BACT|nr:flagellar export chaperone FliS [Desulfonauticus submarinus]SDN65149.1 flagellar biosynthetic protein FliS [Desulfonauticus submarinus]